MTRKDPMSWIDDWPAHAACRGMDPDRLFVQGAAQNRAKSVCASCPVRAECLADALDNAIEFGIWGGMTERERRALLRRRSDVASWRSLLERARDQYELARYEHSGRAEGPSRVSVGEAAQTTSVEIDLERRLGAQRGRREAAEVTV